MVMGHEMGHYVLNHVFKNLLEILAAHRRWAGLERSEHSSGCRQRRPQWGIESSADIAGLPLLVSLLTVYLLIVTPLTNTITRTSEYEADIFGLNASRQPDGFANVTLKLGEYRKLSPGPIEEFLFFDHPSGRTRIFTAMRWKAENIDLDGSTR